MRTADGIVSALRVRGELWDIAPGIVGLRGDALSLVRRLEREIGLLAQREAPEEWAAPPALAMRTLERAEYFSSFPFWLTAAYHLPDDEAALERIATDVEPVLAAKATGTCTDVALPPALCYHVFERFAGRRLTTTQLVTLTGTCWRHEGAGLCALERQWAFTMREIVCVGTASDVEDFRQRGMRLAGALASRLDLDAGFLVATDPFFAPTARGKAIVQRVKALKHELALPIGHERSTAAASFNNHEQFFGEAFGITLASGEPASSGCVAFGLERWLLAFLVAHGVDADAWPSLDATYAEAES
jgi:seryl-tRNA synthetase